MSDIGGIRGRYDGPSGTGPDDGEPVVVDRIRAEIERDGPITFARFMELALYDPDAGYYSAEPARPARSGDFLTAPELDPIFGRALSRQVAEVWDRLGRPQPFVVREDGAGSGALAAAILDGLAADGSPLAGVVRYAPVEHNLHRLAELRARPSVAALGDRLVAPAGPFTGIVLANELLDAFPTHRLEWRAGRWWELRVALRDGRLVEERGDLSTPALAARLAREGVGPDGAIAPREGQRGEVCLAADRWVDGVARDLAAGLVLVVDYAGSAAALWRPDRMDGTALAYRGHRASADLLAAPGRQDLTAHVDLSALELAAGDAGLAVLGTTTQAELLLGCGLEELVEAIRSDPSTGIGRWLAVRAALGRLLDPRATGGFRAVFLARGLAPDPPLRGLAFRVSRSPGPAARGERTGGERTDDERTGGSRGAGGSRARAGAAAGRARAATARVFTLLPGHRPSTHARPVGPWLAGQDRTPPGGGREPARALGAATLRPSPSGRRSSMWRPARWPHGRARWRRSRGPVGPAPPARMSPRPGTVPTVVARPRRDSIEPAGGDRALAPVVRNA